MIKTNIKPSCQLATVGSPISSLIEINSQVSDKDIWTDRCDLPVMHSFGAHWAKNTKIKFCICIVEHS
jgi:hypothetical protein